jgi:hypothetical protein
MRLCEPVPVFIGCLFDGRDIQEQPFEFDGRKICTEHKMPHHHSFISVHNDMKYTTYIQALEQNHRGEVSMTRWHGIQDQGFIRGTRLGVVVAVLYTTITALHHTYLIGSPQMPR